MPVVDGTTTPRVLLMIGAADRRADLARVFEAAGCMVDPVGDGQSGTHLALTREYDAMVIARDLPVVDGISLVRRLRVRGVMARLVVLLECHCADDTIAALDAGADECVVCPLEAAEMVARLRALLRRRYEMARQLRIGAAVLDLDSRSVVLAGGARVGLSARECQLLEVLAGRPAAVHTRQELAHAVFQDARSASLAPTYVYYLRRKLGRAAVRTVHNVGYQVGRL